MTLTLESPWGEESSVMSIWRGKREWVISIQLHVLGFVGFVPFWVLVGFGCFSISTFRCFFFLFPFVLFKEKKRVEKYNFEFLCVYFQKLESLIQIVKSRRLKQLLKHIFSKTKQRGCSFLSSISGIFLFHSIMWPISTCFHSALFSIYFPWREEKKISTTSHSYLEWELCRLQIFVTNLKWDINQCT